MTSRKTDIDLKGEYADVYRKTALFFALDDLFMFVKTDDDALVEVRDVLTNAQSEAKSIEDVLGDDVPKTLKDIKHAFSESTLLKSFYSSYNLAFTLAFAFNAIQDLFNWVFDYDRQRFFLDEFLLMMVVLGLGEMMIAGFRVVASKRFDWIDRPSIITLRCFLFLVMGVSYVILRQSVPTLDIQLETGVIWFLFGIHFLIFWMGLIFVGRRNFKKRQEGRVNQTKEEYWFDMLDETYADDNDRRMIQKKPPLGDVQIALRIKNSTRLRRGYYFLMSILSMGFIMFLIIFGHFRGYSVIWGVLLLLASLGLVGSVLLSKNDKTVDKYAYWLKKRNLEVFEKGVWNYHQSFTHQEDLHA